MREYRTNTHTSAACKCVCAQVFEVSMSNAPAFYCCLLHSNRRRRLGWRHFVVFVALRRCFIAFVVVIASSWSVDGDILERDHQSFFFFFHEHQQTTRLAWPYFLCLFPSAGPFSVQFALVYFSFFLHRVGPLRAATSTSCRRVQPPTPPLCP